jgi:LysM repeat protein
MTNNSAQDTNTTASATQPPVPISPNLVLTALSSASSALAAAANALAQVATALTLQPNTTQPNTPPVCVSQYWSVAGDNCNSMAQQFGVTPADIFAANSFLACDNVWPNTPICVPAPSNANQPGQGSQGHFKQATEHSVQHNALTSHGTQHNVLNGNQRNAFDSHSTQRKAVNTQGKAVQHDLASGDGSDGGGDPSQDPSQSQGGGGGGGCNHGEMQCQGDAFSICNWGQWVVIPCGSGTKCVALPDAGPTCTTDADAAMRMGSDGGGGQSDPSQQGPSQDPSQDPSQQQPPQDQSQGGDSGDGS